MEIIKTGFFLKKYNIINSVNWFKCFWVIAILTQFGCSKKVIPEIDDRYTFTYGGYEYQFIKEAKWDHKTTKGGYCLPTLISSPLGLAAAAITEEPYAFLGVTLIANIIAVSSNKSGTNTYVKDREIEKYVKKCGFENVDNPHRTAVNKYGAVVYRRKTNTSSINDFFSLPAVEITTANVENFLYPIDEFKYPIELNVFIEDKKLKLKGFSIKPLSDGRLEDGFNSVQLYLNNEKVPYCFFQGNTINGNFNGEGLYIHKTKNRPWFCSYRGFFVDNLFTNKSELDSVVINFITSGSIKQYTTYYNGGKYYRLFDKFKEIRIYQATYTSNPFNDKIIDGHSISVICFFGKKSTDWITFKIFRASSLQDNTYAILDSNVPEIFKKSIVGLSSDKKSSSIGFMRKVYDKTKSDEVGPTIMYKPTMEKMNPVDNEVQEINSRKRVDKYFNLEADYFAMNCSGKDYNRISCGIINRYEQEFNNYTQTYESVVYSEETFAYNSCSDINFYSRSNRGERPKNIGSIRLVERADCPGLFDRKSVNDKYYYAYGIVGDREFSFYSDFTIDTIIARVHNYYRNLYPIVKYDTTIDVYSSKVLNNEKFIGILKSVSQSTLASKSDNFIGCWLDLNHLRLYFVEKKMNEYAYQGRYLQFSESLLSSVSPSVYIKDALFYLENGKFQLSTEINNKHVYGDPESEYSNLKIIKQNSNLILLENGVLLKRLNADFSIDPKKFLDYSYSKILLTH
jgi:hypothetical protein